MNSNSPALASERHNAGTWRIMVGYTFALAIFIGLIALVLSYGERLTATGEEVTNGAAAVSVHKFSILYHVLLALVSILLLGRWLGKLFVHFGQPRVIGEMVAGIMLGP